MRLLVGLGNPGEQYEGSRHNAGFECLDQVAGALGLSSWRREQGGELARGPQGALLFKPASFMNRSGQPVRQLADYYRVAPEEICVVADDVYLAPGSLRIRRSGGDGGHNGWKSVLEHLPSDTFWRVRLGVGLYEQRPEHRLRQPALDEYVLQRLPPHDRKLLHEAIDKVAPILVEWLGQGELQEQTLHI